MLLFGLALAANPAFYHPDDVAKGSAVFKKASEGIAPAFEAKQHEVDRAGVALEDLETAIILLGADAPETVSAWSADTRRKVTVQVMRVQKHVDLLQEDYGKVFGDALERALPTAGKGFDVKECKSGAMFGMRPSTTKCVGADLNGPLAAALDADATLRSELAGIAAVEWPTITLPSGQQPVVPLAGTARWVDGAAVARATLADHVQRRRDELDHTVGPLLEDGATPEAVTQAKAAREAWLKVVGADGVAYRGALATALARKKGQYADVGWCANPRSLGGCVGTDVTKEVLATLGEDKKFQKDIAGKFGPPR